MSCIETEEKMLATTTNMGVTKDKVSTNTILSEDSIANGDIEICHMCKIIGSTHTNMISFFEFLENNDMQDVYEIHFPEIVRYYYLDLQYNSNKYIFFRQYMLQRTYPFVKIASIT